MKFYLTIVAIFVLIVILYGLFGRKNDDGFNELLITFLIFLAIAGGAVWIYFNEPPKND